MKSQTYNYKNLLQKLPAEVAVLFEVFRSEVRLVGGCVRDLLLEREVNDFDFATPFSTQKITEILQKNQIKAIPTGEKFGTITAVINKKNFEITTLRKDNETDGRHCVPQFVGDYSLDAARRDFTINALYLDANGIVYDYFNGISDLKKSHVKFIGDAHQRIEEDYLRILRFFRFSCKYSQKLDRKGLEACFAQKENLKKLSRERIRGEFIKIINSPQKQRNIAILKVLKKKKIAAEIFSPKLDIKALERLYKIEENCFVETNSMVKLASLFWSKNLNANFFGEICATNIEKKYFANATKHRQNLDIAALKQGLAFYEKSHIVDFYFLALAKSKKEIDFSAVKKNLDYLNNFLAPEFPLKGEDIMALGYSKKQIGEAISCAKKFWAQSDFKVSKNALIDFVRKCHSVLG